MLEAVESIYYLFNDLVFFLALFVVQTAEGHFVAHVRF